MSKLIAEFHAQFDVRVAEHSHCQVALVEEIITYLLGGGKRVRAKLVWLLGSLGDNAKKQQLLDLSCAIEFIHLATLVHDDVIDQSLLRRGKASVHTKWGTHEAVLVGDFIYSRAFEILVSLGDMRVLRLATRATNKLAEGEIEQLLVSRSPELTREQYFQVIQKKTATLFACACGCAASINGYDDVKVNKYCRIGMEIGMAFQLIDDILDYQPSKQGIGKNPGDDFYAGKYTLPLIALLDGVDNTCRQKIAKWFAQPNAIGFARIVQLMEETNIFVHIRKDIQHHLSSAEVALAEVSHDSKEVTILHSLFAEIANLYHRAGIVR